MPIDTPIRLQTPSYRVRRALARMSRDRWLPPETVRSAALRLASCVSGNPIWTADHAYPMECAAVGMLRGAPPAWRWDADYKDFLDALGGKKRFKPGQPELLILKLNLVRKTNGSEPTCYVR